MENWIERFEELMLNALITEAKDYKNNYIPSSLFKYRTLNEFTLSALLEQKIWVANATTMNDPFESTFTLDYRRLGNKILSDAPITESDKTDFLALGYPADIFTNINSSDDVMKRRIELLRAKSSNVSQYDELVARLEKKAQENNVMERESFINHLKLIVRFCAFSEENDANPMWAYYADQHQGICIEYDVKNQKFVQDCTYPVLYSNSPFDATAYFLDKQKTALISILASLYKGKEWSHEKEWRFTIPNNILESDQLFYIGKPTAIYLGTHVLSITDPIKKDILSKILGYAVKNEIPLYDMQLDRERSKLIPTLRR